MKTTTILCAAVAAVVLSQPVMAASIFVEVDWDRDGVDELYMYDDVAAGLPDLQVWAVSDNVATVLAGFEGAPSLADILMDHKLSMADVGTPGETNFVVWGDLTGDGDRELAVVGDAGTIPGMLIHELVPADIDMDGQRDLIVRLH
ncbi:MAG: hypothetical protein AAFS10_23830 [Myxococcota bacterium]